MEYGSNHLKPSDMWKDIKPRIGEMLVAINDIETRYGKAVDEAYQSGYDDGKGDSSDEDAYQRGLNDAWEAANKMLELNTDTRIKIFSCASFRNTISIFSASECIERLQAYEQEKEEEIQVGDEVVGTYTGEEETEPFVIIRKIPETHPTYYFGIYSKSGEFCQGGLELKKTGRHFPEIAEVLRKMKETEC